MRKKEKKEVKLNLTLYLVLLSLLAVVLFALINHKYEKSKQPAKPQNSTEVLSKAIMFYDNNDFVAAIQQYKKSIALDPKFYPAYIGLGHSYIELGIYDEAIKTFEKTFEIGYSDFRTYYGLGLAYYITEDYDKAHANLKQAYDLNPSNRAVVSYMVNTYNTLGLYDDAINLAKKYLEKEPANHHFYRKIAVSYLLKNDVPNALQNANTALKYNSSFNANHLTLGTAYLYLGRAEDALKEFKIALATYQSSWTHESMSVSYYLLGDVENSAKHANLAASYPKHSFSLSLLGFALLNNKKYDKAIEKFESAIDVKPDYYLPYTGLGKVYIELGQKDKAIQNLERSLQLNDLDEETKRLLIEAKSQ